MLNRITFFFLYIIKFNNVKTVININFKTLSNFSLMDVKKTFEDNAEVVIRIREFKI